MGFGRVADEFLAELASLNPKVLFTFCGFLRAWEQQVDLQVPIPVGSEKLFLEIDQSIHDSSAALMTSTHSR
jgi:hypothetical protein